MNLRLCPFSGQETFRYLAFDCLVVDGQNVMQRPLDKRYGVSPLRMLNSMKFIFICFLQRLQMWFYEPYAKMLRDHPQVASGHPFQ